MYADRHHRSASLDPRSLTIAVAINGTLVAALLLANPVLTIIKPPAPLRIIDVPIQPIPPERLPPPKPVDHHQVQDDLVAMPKPRIDVPVPTNPVDTTPIFEPLPLPSATGPATLPDATPTPALVTTGPDIDPAHRGDLQPTYPASELRAEHEGVVTVRVLVGVDGRVRAVDEVSATSDAFFRATQDQALRRWRFRPAARGGIPIEAWRQMTIRFVIPR